MPWVRCVHGVVSHTRHRDFYPCSVRCNRHNNKLLLSLETYYENAQICTFCGEVGYLGIFDVLVPVDSASLDKKVLLARYKSHTNQGACAKALAAVLGAYHVEWTDNQNGCCCAIHRLCADLSGEAVGLEADEEHF